MSVLVKWVRRFLAANENMKSVPEFLEHVNDLKLDKK